MYIIFKSNYILYLCFHSLLFSNGDHASFSGKFAILGGRLEMSWAFDRPYKEEITEQLAAHGWSNDDVHVTWHVTTTSGTEADVSSFPSPIILFEPGQHGNANLWWNKIFI